MSAPTSVALTGLAVLLMLPTAAGSATAAPRDDVEHIAAVTHKAIPAGGEASHSVHGGQPVRIDGTTAVLPTQDDGAVVMHIPGQVEKASRSADGATVIPDAVGSTDMVTEATAAGGVRTLIKIDDPGAPTRYDFPMDLPAGASMNIASDGSVVLLGKDRVLGAFSAPWARDASGRVVKTHYEVKGNTLTQVVDLSGSPTFPVVADPWWDPTSWPWGKWFAISGRQLQRCGAGAAAGVLGLGIGTATTNVMLKFVAGRAMIVVPGGAYAYVGMGVAGCIVKMIFS